MLFKSIFKNKKILITGHTGFKGSWLSLWLETLGASVIGVSLEPPSSPSHFEVAGLVKIVKDQRLDIQDGDALKCLLLETQPDFVFHLAAQSLVRQSYLNPVETYMTNVLGTLNLLEGLRHLKKPCTAVLITSDKCYENVEWVWGYRETDALGGPDSYSASKGCAELVIRSHVKSFFPKNEPVRIAVGRAGNVIGGGDWAEDRIVPDCIRSWAKGKPVKLRNPNSTRPWQHVLEPLSGYLVLATNLQKNSKLHGEPFNFGPPSYQSHSVQELVQKMSLHWENVQWENNSDIVEEPYESGLLKLNCDKALNYLDWQAILSFQETIRMTADWYRLYYENPLKIREVTLSHIQEYEVLAKERKIKWAL